MNTFLQYLGIDNRDIERRYTQRLCSAVYTTLTHWVLLKNGRKNEIKITQKRLPLMKIEDGYPLQYCHLATQYGESSTPIAHHDAVGPHGNA